MFLIFSEESTWDHSPEAMEEWFEFTDSIADRSESHNALHGPAAATTVKRRNDETLTTDGPFAETREVLGGYYIVDCDSLDDAIEVASRIPAARVGTIEIRPVMDFE